MAQEKKPDKKSDKELLYKDIFAQYERKLSDTEDNRKINPDNKALFLRFMTNLEAQGTTTPQRLSYLSYTAPILEAIGDKHVKDVTKQDMEAIFAGYRSRYKQASMNKIGQCAKTFWRYAYDLASQDPAPPAVRWLKTIKTINCLRSEDLWTEDDISKLINNCMTWRDQVIFSVLFEAGMRPGELRGLKIGDVVFNGDIVRLYMRGKTEKKTGERVVPLVRSYSILKQWVEAHPRKNDAGAWLWSHTNEPIQHTTIAWQLKKTAERAGITKPMNLYILRHSAATSAFKTMPGTLARTLIGHVSGAMESTYVHLSASDLDDAVRERNGIAKKEPEKPAVCYNCHKPYSPGKIVCSFCGLIKDQETAATMTERLERMEKNMERLMNMLLSGDNKGFSALSDKVREKDKQVTASAQRSA